MTLSKHTRREVLARMGQAALALPLSGLLDEARAATATPGFKIGVCDWTLNKRADPSVFEMAKNMGFDGVQVDMGAADADLPMRKPEVRAQIKEMSQKHGIPIASLATGALNDVAYKNDPRAEAWVKESLVVAQDLGVHVILLAFFGNGDLKGDPKGVDNVVAKLKEVAPEAQKAGLVFGIESWLSAEELVGILDRIGSPAVKVYYDVGNSQHMGYDICKEIRFLGKDRICEFHAKDYDNLYGKGSTDFPGVRKAMDDIGYRGWFQVEGFQYPLGMEESLKYDLQYLRGIFQEKV
jgi:L-ribulose-5-phosphate 3-epimerase